MTAGTPRRSFTPTATLVHLMAQMLEPQPGEGIYDPTCGTGGMLISCLAEVKRRGGETRTTGLFGQELITITAAIARMNLVIHGVADFHIASGNTLAAPAFVERDQLRIFDVVLAKSALFDQEVEPHRVEKDAWGRNFLGTPSAGARGLRLLPAHPAKHGPCDGALRSSSSRMACCSATKQAEMRRKLVETDWVECVLGLGPGLFYNSPMEACVIVCRSQKELRGRSASSSSTQWLEIAREKMAKLPALRASGPHPDGIIGNLRMNRALRR